MHGEQVNIKIAFDVQQSWIAKCHVFICKKHLAHSNTAMVAYTVNATVYFHN